MVCTNVHLFLGCCVYVPRTYATLRAALFCRVWLPDGQLQAWYHMVNAQVGAVNQGEDRMGFMQLRIKRHRWFRKLLKNRDPLVFSIGGGSNTNLLRVSLLFFAVGIPWACPFFTLCCPSVSVLCCPSVCPASPVCPLQCVVSLEPFQAPTHPSHHPPVCCQVLASMQCTPRLHSQTVVCIDKKTPIPCIVINSTRTHPPVHRLAPLPECSRLQH